MKRGNRLIASVGTVWFMSLISTNANPKLWQIAFLSIGMYEALFWAVSIARREARRQRRRKYITVTRRDMERVADEVFNPYKEVRA